MEKNLLDYWIVLYKRKTTIVIITFISVITTIALSLLYKPVYEAITVCYVPDKSPAISYMSSNSLGELARAKLVPKPVEDEAGPYIGILKSKKIADLIHQEFPLKKVNKLLRSDISFELTDEYLLRIYSKDNDPVLAANVANAYVKYLNSFLQDASMKNLELDIPMIKGEISETNENLIEAGNALKRFEEESNIASIDEEIMHLTSQRFSFQGKLEDTNVLIRGNDGKIKAFETQLKKEGILIAEQEFSLTNSLIDYLQKKLSDLSVQISSALVELKETHPDVKMLKNQYKETSDILTREIQNLVLSQIKPGDTFYEQLRQELADLVIDKNKLQATLKGYSEAIDRINERLKRLPYIKTEWERLNENMERYKKIYEQLKMNLQEAEMQQARRIQFVVVVDEAKPPESPSFPILWLNVMVALLFGLIAGVFYAFFVDYINETGKIRTAKIIKEVISKE